MNTPIKLILDEVFTCPRLFFKRILIRCAPLVTNDKLYIEWLWYLTFGRKLDLKHPKTFNEKLQWLKLYDRKDIYTIMVDKYAAKKYVADIIGEEYVIPTLGVWDTPDDIDFDKLPKQFVLKCNHNSGLGMCVCKDKMSINVTEVKGTLRRGIKENYYSVNREWPYKNVPHRILAEQYLQNHEDDCLTDYKWFCFDGVPRICYISKDAATNVTTDFFDMEFNHLKIRMKDPNSKILPTKPEQFEEMKKLASKLSQGVPHLRVDFYVVNNKVYVGELTFFHNSGFSSIIPKEWDYKLGEWLKLPIEK